MPDTETLTPDQVAQIEARAEVATPGPWQQGGNYWDRNTVTADNGDCFIADCGKNPMSAGFIAHAREDIPALCRSLRAAWERLRDLESRWDANVAAARECMELSVKLREQLATQAESIAYFQENERKLKAQLMLTREDAERFIHRHLNSAQWEGETLMITFENEALIAALIGDVEP